MTSQSTKSVEWDKPTDGRLFRLLATNLLIGTLCGWLFVAGLIYFDIAGVGSLIHTSPDGKLAVIMLLAVMTITWGSGAMGTAIFLLPKGENEWNGGAKQRNAPRDQLFTGPVPALARAPEQNR